MSDLILTIDSDDEQQARRAPLDTLSDGEGGGTAAKGKGKGKGKGKAKQQAEVAKQKKGKGKKRAREGEDDGEDEDGGALGRAGAGQEDRLAAGFTFDALGGGEMSSRRHGKKDAWDLNETIALFRKKNAPPRVSIDDIIARRKLARPAIVAAGTSANGASGEDSDEVDEDDDEEDDDNGLDEAGPDAFDDDGEGLSDLDALIAEDDDDDNEGSALADADDLIAEGEDVEAVPDSDEDDDAASVASTSSSGSSISPFAQLANNAASLSDAEDEDINFSTAADKHIVDSNYFSKLPETSGNTVTSNEAHVTKSLPPFSALPGAALSRPILLGLSSLSLNTPTPIQAQTIPVALLGKDIVGSSITGSGKTVAFWVGILERLLYRDKKEARTRVVVICPTRELAVQVHNVGQALARYTDIRFCLCVGGLSLKVQEADLRKRPDIVVSTPGRLIDHVRNTASFSLESLEILVIDEADRILEEGFRDELSEIIASCPHSRQTMLFSATITEDIQTLARLSLQKPVRIAIDAVHTTSTNLKQEFVKVKQDTLREPMLIALCRRSFASQGKTIVFFRSKLGAHRMRVLFGLMGLRAEELHGDLTQEMRLTSLKRFRDGEVGFLLATDLASRGLDIKGIETVINYEMPRSFDIYLHRVGRTARAGKEGRAITLVGEVDRKMVKQAIKSSHEKEGSESKQLTIEPELIRSTLAEVLSLKGEVREILREEKEEKEMRRTEMEITKGENLLQYEAEIHSRPARTWFQSEKEKERSKETGKREYNGKMDGESAAIARAARREAQPILNHRQKRRKEALEELNATKGSEKMIGTAIRNRKKEMRPGAISAMGEDNDKRGALAGKAKSNKAKKAAKRGGGFKVDLGDKKRKPAADGDSGMKSSKKGKMGGGASPGGKKSSSMSRGKKGKR